MGMESPVFIAVTTRLETLGYEEETLISVE